jgi:hypothetical protein
MRTGRYSRQQLAIWMEALGPRSRAVMNEAIERAIADAVDGTNVWWSSRRD